MPLGSYCFYQNPLNAQSCPPGFSEGTRTQDDENTSNQSGPSASRNTLPKKVNTYLTGSIIDTTKWYFCCRTGTPTTPISFDPIRSQLPDTFVLFQKGSSCQVINGRTVQTGSVLWNDEDTSNKNAYSGTLPEGVFNTDTRLYTCTYSSSFLPFPPTNLKLTEKSSTSARISWTASTGSGVYYKIYTSPSSTQTTKYSSTLLTFSSLTPSITYTVYIYAGKNNPSGGVETYETVGISIQFTTCPKNYTGLNCEPVCNPTCVHGNCIAPNQCLCDIGWGSSNCNQCANGYYPNNGNCSECDNCNNGVCSDGPSGDGSCQCNTGYATPLNSTQHCTICSDGYVMDNFICVLCHPTCQTCDFNSTHCTSCKSGLLIQDDNSCKSNCPDGTYVESGSCTSCLGSCETCFGGNLNECLSCSNNKLLEFGSCLSNCSFGNYPDQNQICQACQFPCSTCTGPINGDCLSCISPYIRKENDCISETECSQNGFIDSNRHCQECDSTCSRCYGPNNDQCFSCLNGTYLLNGKCLNGCPTNYFSKLDSNVCHSCDLKCSECFGESDDQCSSCIEPFLLNSTSCISTLECSNFGYKDTTFCLPCDESCSKCNGPSPTNCVECPESKYLMEGECLSECPFEYTPFEDRCQSCSYPCLSCDIESTNCLSCVDSYSLNGTSCISHEDCNLGGYINNGTCIACNSNCSTCFGPTSNNCSSCLQPQVLLEQTCIHECPSEYFYVDITNSCEKCDKACLECSGGGENDCLKCYPNFYFHSGQCLLQCPVGYYYNSLSHGCNNCPELCLTCNSESICTTCKSNYSLYGVECVQVCPDGFFSNHAICSQTENQSQHQVGLGVGLTFGFLFLILICLLIFFFIKRQKKEQNEKLKDIFMEKKERRITFLTRKNQRPKLPSNEAGHHTLFDTEIGLETVPAFLMLNFGLDFRIEKQIGKGGSGNLSICSILNEEAKDMFKTELAVVKTLNRKSEHENEDFFNEISITWSLSFHPNIVQLVGYCQEPKCIITKLYERDLFSLLHDPNEKIDPSRVIQLCFCIAKGIEKIHQVGIAHRDLKTKNILIERGQTNQQEDIRAVICDFGLAVTSSNIQIAPPGFSPQYTPPEIFNSIRLKTFLDVKDYQKGDIFSFGVVIWEILTRQIPWFNLFEEIELEIRSGKRLEIGDLEDSLEFLKPVIKQCWLEDPQFRPTPSSILQTFP